MPRLPVSEPSSEPDPERELGDGQSECGTELGADDTSDAGPDRATRNAGGRHRCGACGRRGVGDCGKPTATTPVAVRRLRVAGCVVFVALLAVVAWAYLAEYYLVACAVLLLLVATRITEAALEVRVRKPADSAERSDRPA